MLIYQCYSFYKWRNKWDFRKHFMTLVNKEKIQCQHVVWDIIIGHDLKRHKTTLEWDFRRGGLLTFITRCLPPSAESTVPTVLGSNVLRNFSGELVILVNWLARTINPGESSVKNWWAVEIKEENKQLQTKWISDASSVHQG